MDILGLVTERQREKELFIPAPKTSQLQLDIAGEPAASDPVPAWRSAETEAAAVVVGAEPEASAPKIHGMSLAPSAVSTARNQDKKGGGHWRGTFLLPRWRSSLSRFVSMFVPGPGWVEWGEKGWE